MSENDYEAPTETVRDRLAATVRRGALGAFPGLGQYFIELSETVFKPAIERRLDEWRRDVTEGLRRLEESQRLVQQEMKDDDAFLDTFFQASQAAI